MKKATTDTIVTLLIILWVYAAVSKLTGYRLFVISMEKQPLPAWMVSKLIWALPAAELSMAAMLSTKRLVGYGLLLSALLLFSFAGYTALALSGAYGSIPCSCGGIFSFMQWKGHFIFNVTTFWVALTAWILLRKEERLKEPIRE